jgi:cytochrome c
MLCLGLVFGALLPALDNPAAEKRGRDLFLRRCSGCHSLDRNMEGPRLRDIYRRKAASAHGFAYSEALKKLQFRWDDSELDRWLEDPDSVAPDTNMEFRVADAEERAAVIAYLKSLDMKGVNKP